MEVSTGYRQVSTHGNIMPDIEPFVSPIDGSIISSRPHLRAHNKRHDVTNIADYSPEFIEKAKTERLQRAQGSTPAQKRERERQVAAAYDKLARR